LYLTFWDPLEKKTPQAYLMLHESITNYK